MRRRGREEGRGVALPLAGNQAAVTGWGLNKALCFVVFFFIFVFCGVFFPSDCDVGFLALCYTSERSST